ncbi:lysophospholipid acyltransferase family protein [Conexibacter stalactiti]|uniref:Lysophospholipid acyltransferase family protein n=1 Tax=Conexibacter stalactiti TaxID=1940611 RepID=A0ABU4HZ86_9ACTN|nr:lysophospholipid acyltransferase family protein [Conexibacter stalactiti]MDW5598615.1 lysophospholipid acyltransferase family protein [Conexibacter stalactiti]MEC5039257.1 lysophospholipid acyltransferase family protein [Conexibacter stalactiti]
MDDQPWVRTAPARAARELIVCGVFDTIVRTYARREVSGAEQLDGPAIFVANHCSHVDTPVLLRALPGPWRRRTAVAAAADYFYTRRSVGAAVSLAFCTVPLVRKGRGGEAGGGGGTAALGPLLADGWSLAVFAEGTRSRDGRVGRLHTGGAVLAAAHGLPIVPVHIDGTRAAMPIGRSWMVRPESGGRFARHDIRVRFGAPIEVSPEDDRFEVMERVRLFMAECGAETTPDPKLAARRAAATGAAERAAGRAAGGSATR